MFDGKARQSARPVSMGGVSKKESSTKELVDKSRKLREQRLEDKQRQNSATRIQSCWRGATSRSVFQAQSKTELDQKVAGITKIKELFSARNQVFNVPLDTLLILFRLYNVCYMKKRNNCLAEYLSTRYTIDTISIKCQEVHCRFIYSLYLDSISNASAEFNLLSKLIISNSDKQKQLLQSVWRYHLTNILILSLHTVNDDLTTLAQSSSSLGSVSFTETIFLMFKLTFLICKCDSPTFFYSTNAEFQIVRSLILNSVIKPLCIVLRKLILTLNCTPSSLASTSSLSSLIVSKSEGSNVGRSNFKSADINLVTLFLNLVIKALGDLSSSSSTGRTRQITRNMVTQLLLTVDNLHSLAFMQPLIHYMNEYNYEGWESAVQGNDGEITNVGISLKGTSSRGSGTSSGTDRVLYQFASDQFMQISVLRNFIRCVMVDNSSATVVNNKNGIKTCYFSPVGLNIISSFITDYKSGNDAKGQTFSELINDSLKYAPVYTVLRLMERGGSTTVGTDETAGETTVVASDFSGVKYIEFTMYKYHQSVKKREVLSLQRRTHSVNPTEPASSSASSFPISMHSMIMQPSLPQSHQLKRQQIKGAKNKFYDEDYRGGGVVVSLDPLADLLNVLVSNADVLSVTLNDCLLMLGISSQKRNFDSSRVSNHDQSSSDVGAISRVNKHSLLSGFTAVYMKILVLTPTSIDSDSASAAKLNVTSSPSTLPAALLSDAYVNTGASLGSSLLNTLAFSYSQSGKSLSQRLWKYLGAFGTDMVLEALILNEENIVQNMDAYTSGTTGIGNTNSLFSKPSISSSSSSSVTSRCSKDFVTAAQSVGMDCENLCVSMSTVFWLFCTVFTHQLAAIDDEELFDSHGNLTVEDITAIVLLLKKLLNRLYCSTASAVATVSFNLSKLLTEKGDNRFFFDAPNATTITTASALIKDMIDFEDRVISRQHQLWIYTRLFNALFAVNLRRPFMGASDWQWSGVNALISDIDRKMQELANTTSDSIHNSSSGDFEKPTDMSQLLANDNMKAVLSCIPQVIPFAQRILIFQTLIALDSHKHVSPSSFFGGSTRVQIHRAHILEDSMDQLSGLSESKLKGRIQVEFVAETGTVEAGIDGGGLFKAFLDLFMKQAFDTSLGLFVISQDQLLTPNPGSALAIDDHLQYFHFIGKMLGIAVYNRILVEPQLTGTFLNTLLGKSNHINELHYLDKQILHSLMELKHMASLKPQQHVTNISAGEQLVLGPDDDPIAKLGLMFEVNREGAYDSMRITEELIPNGTEILVTKHNVHSYIHRYAHFKLNLETAQQTRAFLSGFRQLIPTDWLRIFSTQELQLVISGEQKPIDITDLRRNVNYGGGYMDSDPYIQEFWKIVENLDLRQQGLLLKFITSCSRQPLLGFSKLNPHIGIQKISCYNFDTMTSSVAQAPRLPSAATCMNLLKLPYYDSIDILKEKLLYAINSESGFELS